MTDTKDNSVSKLDITSFVAQVTANPATLVFPTDRWGFTSAIKREILKAASTVQGQQDKNDLLVTTLAILITHIQKRLEPDREVQSGRLAIIEAAKKDRTPRELIGSPAKKED